jgi:phage terminase large subunit-like protein
MTAQTDGSSVRQGVEVVGAQVGALQTLLADPLLAALTFTPITVHADKLTRALPAIARCEQGKLAIVRAGWNKEFLDEISAFPESRHDDQVDGLAAGLQMIADGGGSGQVARAIEINPNDLNLEFGRRPFGHHGVLL